MGSPLRLLLCLVAAKALNPKNKPQTQACVDDQGNAIECVQPDDGPGSLQDQFVEKVATARRLKGLEAAGALVGLDAFDGIALLIHTRLGLGLVLRIECPGCDEAEEQSAGAAHGSSLSHRSVDV